MKLTIRKTQKGTTSTCTKCRGSGVVLVKIPNADHVETCPNCNGSGKVERCPEYV